jgi:hypothetical protein
MATPVTVFTARITHIYKHPDADRLDIGEVLGWQVVIGRDMYKNGQLVVFFEPDTLLPAEVIDRLGVRAYLKGSEQNRVGQTNLRGKPSFGLVIPPDDPTWTEGMNVAAHYGATKYIPPLRATCGDAEADHNLFHKYTDIQNLRSHPTVFQDDEMVIATEKIDGTNSRVAMIGGERMAGSMDLRRKWPFRMIMKEGIPQDIIDRLGKENLDLCPSDLTRRKVPEDVRKLMRALEIKTDMLYDRIPAFDLTDPAIAANTYWFPWTLEPVQNLLNGLAGELGSQQVILFGEVYGAGVPNGLDELNYGVIGKMGYRAFDLYVNGRYLDYPLFLTTCAKYGVDTVPVLYKGPFSMQNIRAVSDGQSTLAGHIREGTVVHPVVERTHPEVGRLVMKYLGDTYCLKKKRDFKDQ